MKGKQANTDQAAPAPSIDPERYVLETSQRFSRSREELFEFFSDPSNLGRITPPWLDFRILTPLPIDVCEGAQITYRLRLHHVPINWLTRITQWQPPHRFVDEQLAGPYRCWVHEHRLVEEGGQTIMYDRVQFLTRGPRALRHLVHRLFVNQRVREIFAYRQGCLSDLLGGELGSAITIRRAAGA
ncbi:MAG: SRPBCC family protein [Phycisphaeraceae bacterium]